MALPKTRRVATSKPPAAPTRGDELTPIIKYIIGEMSVNASSPAAMKIRENNTFSAVQCLEEYYEPLPTWRKILVGQTFVDMCTQQAMTSPLAAIAGWAMLVHEGGDWDHKPYIRAHFTPAVTAGEQHWHHSEGWLYYYDIWSNIHYGYVGRACGFTRDGLLDGAGLEQIGSDLVHGRLPSGDSMIDGMRRFDDASDRASVEIGCDLWPGTPSVEDVRARVLAAPVSKKAL